MKEKILCIEWDDATYVSGYYDKKSPENFTPTRTRTVGHLIKKTSSELIISMERFYDDDKKPFEDRHITIIPRGMIKSITELKGCLI